MMTLSHSESTWVDESARFLFSMSVLSVSWHSFALEKLLRAEMEREFHQVARPTAMKFFNFIASSRTLDLRTREKLFCYVKLKRNKGD